MRPEFIDMKPSQTVVASPGTTFEIGRLREKTLQVALIAGGTLQVEASDDGTNFAQLGTNIIADGFIQLAETVKFIRIATTINTGGATVVILGGLDSRSD